MIRFQQATPTEGAPGLIGDSTGDPAGDASDVTRWLFAWGDGSPEALDHLIPLVLHELRRAARRCLDREPDDHTLQPTALVHELYLHLRRRRGVSWEGRRQFLGYAVRAMRRILVDHARRRRSKKRGEGRTVLPFEPGSWAAAQRADELVALDEALERLARLDPRQARVVELRFFGGLTYSEIARVMDVSPRTARRHWQTARLWLRQEMGDGRGS
jgi:RNA polymerase sigma factor (TIGR02999 family)